VRCPRHLGFREATNQVVREMPRQIVGKRFSFSTDKHIEEKESDNAEYIEMYLSREELLRVIAACTNRLITSDKERFLIQCWKKKHTHQCIVFPA